MALIEKHTPGSFCWFELATSDQNAAKTFYSSLFGWTSQDFPMGPDSFYTMFALEGRQTSAAYTLQPDQTARGVPPHWMPYIATESADETAKKAAKAGGTVIAEPFDVYTFGRMAVIQDPTGAFFSVWEPKSHPGTGITGIDGTVCWLDLSTPDVERAKQFYSDVFGWEIGGVENDPSGYLIVKNGSESIGGIPPAAYRNPNAPPHWLLYFLVSDSDASTAKAKGMGANVLMPEMTMEGVGRWSVVGDPQGAIYALFQAAPRG